MSESTDALRTAFDDEMDYYIDEKVTGLPVVGSVGFAYETSPETPETLDTRICDTEKYETEWIQLDTALDDEEIGNFFFTAQLTDRDTNEKIGVKLWDDMVRVYQEEETLSFETFKKFVDHLETNLGTELQLAYNGN